MKQVQWPDYRAGVPNAGVIDLDVEGMHCAACVTRIERFLAKVDGVGSASVNLATNRARVVYDPVRVEFAQLLDAVERAGYRARLVTPGNGYREVQISARDLIGASAVGLPVLVAGMLWMRRPVLLEWVLCAASASVIFGFGWSFFLGAWKAIINGGGATMDSLIALGSSAAWGYSVCELIAARLPQTYFETGSTIVTLILMGRYLEGRARRRAGDALRTLAVLTPRFALRVEDGDAAVSVTVEHVRVGDILRVRPGEKVPVDGLVVTGNSTLDESLLTGESTPVEKTLGSNVIAGSMNTTGALDIRATAVGSDTALARIVRLVEDAQASKPPVQRLADRVCAYFVPIVLAIAVGTLLYWLAAHAPLSAAVRNAVAVLVIACPCALGLATPTAILVAVGRAAASGILIRDAQALESACRVSTVVFDKTGTLTEGRFAVVKILPASDVSEQALLSLAAAAEQNSEHPVAQGILRKAGEDHIIPARVEYFQSVGGSGVDGIVDGKRTIAGTRAFLAENSVTVPPVDFGGGTVVYLARDGRYFGAIVLKDNPRSAARQAVAALKSSGLRIAMITGDAEPVAREIAGELGIETLMADVKPEAKAKVIRQIQRDNGGVVAMVGDGVNDAAAIATADVGIAMGGATDVASEAASITLLRADLCAIGQVIHLSRRTVQVMRQNLFWAFAFNSIGIPLAASGHLSPMIAALAMAFSSVFVVSNSLRLKCEPRQTSAPPT